MALKIEVDWDLCESNALCMRVAPDYFQVDDNDMLQVLSEGPKPDDVELVKRAVRACPKAALSLVEE